MTEEQINKKALEAYPKDVIMLILIVKEEMDILKH